VAGPGPLVLAGGAEFLPAMADADRALLDLLGRRARVAVLPTAADRRPDLAAANGVRHFRSLGAQAAAAMITDRRSAAEHRHAALLDSADLVYMAGGNPRHLVESLAGSPAWETLRRRWREGMALGGSSAGAMVLCRAMLFQEEWAEGLDVVPDAAVLPHFERRDAAARRQAAAALGERSLLGIGIDESTAVIWSEGSWRVAGRGSVHVLGRDPAYAAGDTVEGLPAPR
jgi:cyanophycinase